MLHQTIEDPERFGTPVDDELEAGEVSFHADLILHGSEADRSERRRCGLTLGCTSADVLAHPDWNQKGVIVSGSDSSSPWANRGRPNSE